MDKKMQIAIDEFIMARINAMSDSPPEPLSKAFKEFYSSTDELKGMLSEQQHALYRGCENAFSLLEGETQYAYYRAGFSNAISFFIGWRDGA